VTLPHLIAVDLDGTLLGTDKRVSARTRAAVAAAAEAGHHVVAVTGRSRASAVPLLASTPEIDCIVGSNGAYAHRVPTGHLDWSRPIRAAEADVWINAIRTELPDAAVGWESDGGIIYEPEFLALVGDPKTIDPGEPGTEPLAGALYKLFVRTPSIKGRDLQALVADLLAGIAEVSTSGVPFVEVTATGVDKGSALERIARALDLPMTRTIAFGDNHNDVPMFRAAGVAVAMGNAVPEVHALVDRVAPPNTADGVAVVLEEMLGYGMRLRKSIS